MTKSSLHITSLNIKDGVLDKDYGGYGKHPSVSFELKWDEVKNAKSYALYMIDYDATHVTGYPYIHWVVANIKHNKLDHNATHIDESILQGANSSTPKTYFATDASFQEHLDHCVYNGPFPPDKDHTYTLVLYALDTDHLDLKPGYYLDDLLKEVRKHAICYDEIEFLYKKD